MLCVCLSLVSAPTRHFILWLRQSLSFQSTSILITGLNVPLHPRWRRMGSGPCPSASLHMCRHRRLPLLPFVGSTRTGDPDVAEVERPVGEVVGQSASPERKHRLFPYRTANCTFAAALGCKRYLSTRWDWTGAILGQHVFGCLRRLCDPHHDWGRTGRDDLR